MKRTYDDLQELTGHESGAVQYGDGSIWIGNWTGINGIPRLFATGTIGLGGTLTAVPCNVPEDVELAMNDHEREQGTEVSTEGFAAWEVNGGEVIVVTQSEWA
ncbi:MAG: hypothetical protein DYG87_03750 [Anaerolineae bacterium CFX3]|jgi:hypothetical protein|nr:hypothetical protein [Anaerolineae bacterium CFX3]MCQ3945739.1 hypothetical protein [Anaerolineae bacterium]RIK27215.1 MAG: hypothetical protein DCC54_03880 [Anaerolineae bacterium]WKZ55078.1 MAG: hypothetical protein QY324_03440 [Anaerolineales bacterium]GJQ37494.1 MAG: hypothetical protein JETCAE01_35040 [Anaerolineaceae bacterium]